MWLWELKLLEVAVVEAVKVAAGVPFDAVEGGVVDDNFPPRPDMRKTKTSVASP